MWPWEQIGPTPPTLTCGNGDFLTVMLLISLDQEGTWVPVCIKGFHTILFVIQPGLRTTEFSFLKKKEKNVWQAITLPSKSQMNAILRHSCSAPLGYQLNSAECVDIRLKRVVPDHYCHYYPENVKPKPKLKECSMDPCPSRFVSLPFGTCIQWNVTLLLKVTQLSLF